MHLSMWREEEKCHLLLKAWFQDAGQSLLDADVAGLPASFLSSESVGQRKKRTLHQPDATAKRGLSHTYTYGGTCLNVKDRCTRTYLDLARKRELQEERTDGKQTTTSPGEEKKFQRSKHFYSEIHMRHT